jgi:phosphotransferase system enzyme I (PtsP)
VFRTLDVGSDKILPYWRMPAEENPAMGWRAIRMTLDRPQILRGQLRACSPQPAAGSCTSCSRWWPRWPSTWRAPAARHGARAGAAAGPGAARAGRGRGDARGAGPVLAAGALLPRIDFLSVGSNDLFQFLFACDRGNPALSDRYDALAPAALGFLRDLARRCREAGVRLSVCGEMASRPLEAMALVGLGVRQLSVSPSEVGPVKAMVRSLEAAPWAATSTGWWACPTTACAAASRPTRRTTGWCCRSASTSHFKSGRPPPTAELVWNDQPRFAI